MMTKLTLALLGIGLIGVAAEVNWVGIIAGIAAVITASTPGLLAWMNSKKALAQAKETHQLVNSRMTELLELAKSKAKVDGVVEGIATEKADQALKAKGALESDVKEIKLSVAPPDIASLTSAVDVIKKAEAEKAKNP